MRTSEACFTAGLILVLGLTLQASGQQPTASTFFTGANPREITFKPVNTTASVRSMPIDRSFIGPRPRPASVFSLGNVYPTISLGSWPPKVPQVFALDSKHNPYQPNPPKGINLLDFSKKKDNKKTTTTTTSK